MLIPRQPAMLGPLLLGFTIQWIDVGPLPVSQVALFIPLLALFPTLMSGKIARPPILFLTYFLFLAALMAMLPFSGDLLAGTTAIVRGIVYSTLAFCTYAWLRLEDPEDRCRELSRAIFWVAPGFFAVFYLSAMAAGVNLIDAIVHTVTTGNPYILQYRMFNLVLNGGVVEDGLSSAARHGIVISLLSAVFLHVFLRERKSLLGTLLCIAIVLFALLSLSRSALLGAALGLMCYALFRLAEGRIRWARVLLFVGVGFIAMNLGNVNTSGLTAILSEKFVSDIANNPRVMEFFQIVDRISDRAVFGWGSGTGLNLFGLEAQYPHNFILYGWHQAGLIGFAISLFFTILVVQYIFFATSSSMRYAKIDQRVARMYCLSAMLMCFVLVRLMFAKAGLLAVPEWIALALACFIARSARKLRAELSKPAKHFQHREIAAG